MKPRPVSQKEEQIVDRLSSLDLQALYAELGQQLGTLAPGEDAELKAKSWLTARREEIHSLVCIKAQYCAFISKNPNARLVDIVGALSDVLVTVFGGIPVYTLAMLLVRSGLDGYCNCESQKE